jgi:hypothetical protein
LGLGRVCTIQAKIFLNQGSTTLTNFEVDATGSAFSYSVTTGTKNLKQYKLFKFPFFCSIKNINTGIDFNFRAGIKYFYLYKIESSAETAKELVTIQM